MPVVLSSLILRSLMLRSCQAKHQRKASPPSGLPPRSVCLDTDTTLSKFTNVPKHDLYQKCLLSQEYTY